MKLPSLPSPLILRTGAIAVFCLFALPENALAKGPGNSQGHGNSSNHKKSEKDERTARERQAYSSHPRSSFTLTLGNGYAGRGYYYGPPNSAYYYQRSEVRFYATRAAAPRAYYGNAVDQSNSTDAAVQRELSRRGYYSGPIDGAIGAQSRRAIVRYQQDRGLRQTGTITPGLLQSLGLH